jgi:hypothetical protein
MPRSREAKKDVVSCEKLRVTANKYRSADFRMEQSGSSNVLSFLDEFIVQEGERGEVKHLSNPRKRK